MDDLETGKDKIKKICEILKQETLQPAKREAQQVIEAAQEEANKITKEAEAKASALIDEAKAKMQKERALFDQSLVQAARQGIETLKQEIEKKLFNDELGRWIEETTADPQIASTLITALVDAIKKEGISADLSAEIPKHVPTEKVNSLLAKEILAKLQEKGVVIGDFAGGVRVKLHDRRLVLDLSDEALSELLGSYIRKDFRERFFQNQA